MGLNVAARQEYLESTVIHALLAQSRQSVTEVDRWLWRKTLFASSALWGFGVRYQEISMENVLPVCQVNFLIKWEQQAIRARIVLLESTNRKTACLTASRAFR